MSKFVVIKRFPSVYNEDFRVAVYDREIDAKAYATKLNQEMNAIERKLGGEHIVLPLIIVQVNHITKIKNGVAVRITIDPIGENYTHVTTRQSDGSLKSVINYINDNDELVEVDAGPLTFNNQGDKDYVVKYTTINLD